MSTANIDVLLKQLAAYKRQKAAEEYAREFFDPLETYTEHCNEDMQKRMDLLSCVIESFFPSDFATLIHLHYVNAIPIDKCAECMGVSRATAYRLLSRAKEAVNKRYQRIFGDQGGQQRDRP